ncbi:MAG TPA: hypothetical protein GXZ90_00160 [Clostridiales bacterium]|nr:hypothetical protein [Clostridiales bacterium]
MKYNRISVKDAFRVTAPFIAVRTLVYLVTTIIMVLAGAIGLLLMMKGGGIGIYLGLFIIIASIAFSKWVERYILYLIKAGHIFTITEYIRTGNAPQTEKGYKNVLAFGTETVKKYFGSTNVAFIADTLISKSVNQIMRFLNRIGNFLSFIPGAAKLIEIISMVLGIALNYIDEAILSYIFMHGEETNSWKKACDAIVYYGQSWKKMIKGAAKVAISIIVFRFAVLALGLFVGLIVAGGSGAVIGFFAGYIIMYALNKIVIDLYATVIMINDYYAAIEGQALQTDLYAKFSKASSKFKELIGKTNQGVENIEIAN